MTQRKSRNPFVRQDWDAKRRFERRFDEGLIVEVESLGNAWVFRKSRMVEGNGNDHWVAFNIKECQLFVCCVDIFWECIKLIVFSP